MTGTPRACYRSISIVSDGRLGVCDGAHWAFVMKKSQRPRPSLRDRTGHPRPRGIVVAWVGQFTGALRQRECARMASAETTQPDATSSVIRLMKHQAEGILCEGLLTGETRAGFEALLGTARDKDPVLSRAGAGSLLIGKASDKEFIAQVATRLTHDLEAVFWVEMGEQLIRNTSCKFAGFGEFKRFDLRVSFIPELLSDRPTIPSVASAEAVPNFAIDALCRVILERLRAEIRDQGAALASLPALASELLIGELGAIFPVLFPPAKDAFHYFASAAALASYYAWVAAFDATILRNFPVGVKDVGSFTLVPGPTSRVDFVADREFEELIRCNVQPDLPHERIPPMAAA